jgi:hypothetical protein
VGAGVLALGAIVAAYLYLRPGSDEITVRTAGGPSGALEARVPSSWEFLEEGNWDEVIAGTPQVLGPLAMLVNPGRNRVEDITRDDRPFLFATLFDDAVAQERSFENWLEVTSEPWNADRSVCSSIEATQTRDVLVERRYAECRGDGGFLQRIEKVDGRVVYGLVRFTDDLTEREAREILDSVELSAPGS